ncbi:MAG: hypothetical protein ACLFTH_03000 [Candidatus Woesearchaeota archaeon]
MVDETFQNKRAKLLAQTKRAVADSFSPDVTVGQLLAVIDELMIQANNASKRLREWHGAVMPEVSHKVTDHERFCRLVSEKTYEELKKEFCNNISMAASIDETSYQTIREFASHVISKYDLKDKLLKRLEDILSNHAPNMLAMCGTTIAARLITSAGSLKKVSFLPASTIQMLGAEKALFRHLRSGARAPKHGYIYAHPLLSRAKNKDAGKIARTLADKISMCARLDYFKGEFKAKEYYAELENKFFPQGESR